MVVLQSAVCGGENEITLPDSTPTGTQYTPTLARLEYRVETPSSRLQLVLCTIRLMIEIIEHSREAFRSCDKDRHGQHTWYDRSLVQLTSLDHQAPRSWYPQCSSC